MWDGVYSKIGTPRKQHQQEQQHTAMSWMSNQKYDINVKGVSQWGQNS